MRHEKSQHEALSGMNADAPIRESNARPREEEEEEVLESDEDGSNDESGEDTEVDEEDDVSESNDESADDESDKDIEVDEEDDVSESNDESGSSMDEDEEEETVWDGFARDAIYKHEEAYQEKKEQLVEHGFTQTLAKDHAFQEILPDVQKTFRQIYLRTIHLLQQLKKDPIHKKILSTKRKLEDEEGFSEEEAWDYAIKKRKYLLNQLITNTLEEEEKNEEDPLSMD